MRVVRDHKNAIARYSGALISAASGFTENPIMPRFAVVPELFASGGVEGINLIPPDHVHDPVHDHGSRLEPRRGGDQEFPSFGQPLHIASMNLLQPAVTVSRLIPVIVQPVGLRGDGLLPIHVTLTAQ